MAVWNIFPLFLAFQGFLAATGSLVKIHNGGYEDIVIAIHPGTQEDDLIIEKIQVSQTIACVLFT
uniref:Calcium-activated chloride channel N-terminal domain-containing protein n=1 Tax=Leptobrachium leishanense TaxID=445787 RepID=A0A8C5R7Y4_9ANUR